MRLNSITRSGNVGVTLVELAVVLTIIGLLAGIVVASTTLIENARMQRIVNEYTVFKGSIQEFRDKYTAYPGDMNTAQAIWGSLAAGVCSGTTAVTTHSAGVGVCNGDGGNGIGSSTSGGAITNTNLEWWGAWRHLSQAGLIEGRYTGANFVASTATTDAAGTNLPLSDFPLGAWKLFYFINTADTTGTGAQTPPMWGDSYGNMLAFGNSTSTTVHASPVLTAAQAYDLDTKLDDGLPGTGTVRTWRNNLTGHTLCNTNNTSQTAARYNLSNTTTTCALLFVLGY